MVLVSHKAKAKTMRSKNKAKCQKKSRQGTQRTFCYTILSEIKKKYIDHLLTQQESKCCQQQNIDHQKNICVINVNQFMHEKGCQAIELINKFHIVKKTGSNTLPPPFTKKLTGQTKTYYSYTTKSQNFKSLNFNQPEVAQNG